MGTYEVKISRFKGDGTITQTVEAITPHSVDALINAVKALKIAHNEKIKAFVKPLKAEARHV